VSFSSDPDLHYFASSVVNLSCSITEKRPLFHNQQHRHLTPPIFLCSPNAALSLKEKNKIKVSTSYRHRVPHSTAASLTPSITTKHAMLNKHLKMKYLPIGEGEINMYEHGKT
ncbi:10083_t:CDS:2, partial [Dentiscutata erythropus]